MSEPLDQHRRGKTTDRRKLALQWTAHHDARNLILLGDPAVYLGGQRSNNPGFCCDRWTTAPDPTPPAARIEQLALTLPDDLRRFIEAEAKHREIEPGDWVAALVRDYASNR